MLIGLIRDVAAVPRNFFMGLIVGLGTPVAALVGIAGGVYLFTGKVPFLSELVEEEGERRLVLRLMSPDEARAAFNKRKEEITSIIEQVKSEIG